VLLRGVWIGTLYKLLRSTITHGCNNIIVLENETSKTPTLPVEKTML
jgi:hypothetical protein